MIQALYETNVDFRKFKADPWLFQKTFKTPLQDLNRFVSTFMAPFSLTSGVLSTDLVVFEPHNLLGLASRTINLAEYYGSPKLGKYYKIILKAEGQQAIAELLEAALGDSVDFEFLPLPEAYAIYADHDEYTTFYSRVRADLQQLSLTLEHAGFEPVLNWQREFSLDNLK